MRMNHNTMEESQAEAVIEAVSETLITSITAAISTAEESGPPSDSVSPEDAAEVAHVVGSLVSKFGKLVLEEAAAKAEKEMAEEGLAEAEREVMEKELTADEAEEEVMAEGEAEVAGEVAAAEVKGAEVVEQVEEVTAEGVEAEMTGEEVAAEKEAAAEVKGAEAVEEVAAAEAVEQVEEVTPEGVAAAEEVEQVEGVVAAEAMEQVEEVVAAEAMEQVEEVTAEGVVAAEAVKQEDGVVEEEALEEGDSSASNDALKCETRGGKFGDVGQLYPQRPGKTDCAYYMKTGRCSYGRSCVFNHPPRMKGQGRSGSSSDHSQIDRDEEEVLDRPGVQKCKYFLMSGYCKYGSACRFSHPQEKRGASPPVLNFLGLPIRPGEKECSFYMRTGSCKFASNCRFHHPEPTAIGGSDARDSLSGVPLQSYVQEAPQPPVPSWSQYHMPVLNISSGVVHSDSEWDSYQAPPDPSCLPEKRSSNQQNAQIDESPERPGQPECQLYMKTGVCRYKSACEYHHPKTRPSKTSGCFINPLGLPLRPDQAICAHFSRYGICKVGPSCKFDHSMNYLPGKPPSSV